MAQIKLRIDQYGHYICMVEYKSENLHFWKMRSNMMQMRWDEIGWWVECEKVRIYSMAGKKIATWSLHANTYNFLWGLVKSDCRIDSVTLEGKELISLFHNYTVKSRDCMSETFTCTSGVLLAALRLAIN